MLSWVYNQTTTGPALLLVTHDRMTQVIFLPKIALLYWYFLMDIGPSDDIHILRLNQFGRLFNRFIVLKSLTPQWLSSFDENNNGLRIARERSRGFDSRHHRGWITGPTPTREENELWVINAMATSRVVLYKFKLLLLPHYICDVLSAQRTAFI